MLVHKSYSQTGDAIGPGRYFVKKSCQYLFHIPSTAIPEPTTVVSCPVITYQLKVWLLEILSSIRCTQRKFLINNSKAKNITHPLFSSIFPMCYECLAWVNLVGACLRNWSLLFCLKEKRTNQDPPVELTHLYSRNPFAHQILFKVTPKFQNQAWH